MSSVISLHDGLRVVPKRAKNKCRLTLIIFIICFSITFFSCGKKQEKIIKKSTENVVSTYVVTTQSTFPAETKKTSPTKQTKLTETVEKIVVEEKQKEEIVYPPKIEFISYEIIDANKDGKIVPGEKFILKVKVKNIGKGVGKELTVKVDTCGYLYTIEGTPCVAENEISIFPVEPGQIKEFSINFWTPSVTLEKIPVKLIFSEGTKKEIVLNIEQKTKTQKQIQVEQEKEKLKEKMKKHLDELDKEME